MCDPVFKASFITKARKKNPEQMTPSEKRRHEITLLKKRIEYNQDAEKRQRKIEQALARYRQLKAEEKAESGDTPAQAPTRVGQTGKHTTVIILD